MGGGYSTPDDCGATAGEDINTGRRVLYATALKIPTPSHPPPKPSTSRARLGRRLVGEKGAS